MPVPFRQNPPVEETLTPNPLVEPKSVHITIDNVHGLLELLRRSCSEDLEELPNAVVTIAGLCADALGQAQDQIWGLRPSGKPQLVTHNGDLHP